jgi:hypothetical protein
MLDGGRISVALRTFDTDDFTRKLDPKSRYAGITTDARIDKLKKSDTGDVLEDLSIGICRALKTKTLAK